jgi:hypothetical protein
MSIHNIHLKSLLLPLQIGSFSAKTTPLPVNAGCYLARTNHTSAIDAKFTKGSCCLGRYAVERNRHLRKYIEACEWGPARCIPYAFHMHSICKYNNPQSITRTRSVPTPWNLPLIIPSHMAGLVLHIGDRVQGTLPTFCNDPALSLEPLYLRWALSASCLCSNCSFSYSATLRCLKYCTCQHRQSLAPLTSEPAK